MTTGRIISGLKHCSESPSHCNGCPCYADGIKGDICRQELMREALSLLIHYYCAEIETKSETKPEYTCLWRSDSNNENIY